jgi:hypothetical protein
MNEKTTSQQLPEPQRGGSHERMPDGSLRPVPGTNTQPIIGRTEASRQALAERTAAPAAPDTNSSEE